MCAGGLSKHLIDSLKSWRELGELNMTFQPLCPFPANTSSSKVVTAFENGLVTLKPPWIIKSPISQNASAFETKRAGLPEFAVLI